jgi:hypothetical protein
MKQLFIFCGLFRIFCACGSSGADLRIMIPLYSYPEWYAPASYVWDEVAAAGSNVPVTAIINPNNGPDGGPPNDDYIHGLNDLRNGGITILGYVATGYGTRDIAMVKAEIDLYDTFYNIDGIFLDEADNTTHFISYYTNLYAYVKSRTNLNHVVINPGIGTVENYISAPAADTAVIFEVNQGWLAYVPAPYVSAYPPERFCALLYSVTNEATMRQYVDLAVQRNIGYIYVTNDKGANPWDTIPSYWTDLVKQKKLNG